MGNAFVYEHPKSVIMVVKGPLAVQVSKVSQADSVCLAHPGAPMRREVGPTYRSDPQETWRQLGYAHERGEQVDFRIMPGWMCTNVQNLDGSIDVQPQLLAPITMGVAIEQLACEPQNPQGVSILATVRNIMNYARCLIGDHDRYSIPIVAKGDLVRISYSLTEGTGGLQIIHKQGIDALPDEDSEELFVNSLSGLRCDVIDEGSAPIRGRSIYRVIKSWPSASAPVA